MIENRWTSKPPVGWPLNQSHPLVQGLIGFYAINEAAGPTLYDATGNLPLAVTGFGSSSPWGLGTSGVGLNCAASNEGAKGTVPAYLQWTGPITMAVGFANLGSHAEYGTLCGIFPNNTNVSPYRNGCIMWRGSANQFEIDWNGGSWPSAGSVAAGAIGVVSTTIIPGSSGSIYIYINGIQDTYRSATITAPTWTSTGQFAVGVYPGFAVNCNSLIYWASWWNRTLAPGEHATIGANPGSIWHIFQPPRSRAFLGFSSGSSVFTQSGAGGFVLASSGIHSSIYTPSQTGGTVLGGVASPECDFTALLSGGTVLGGIATESSTYFPGSAGGTILGGIVTESSAFTPALAGGAVLGGIAAESSTYAPIPAGGAVLSGVAYESSLFDTSSAGGTILGSIASVAPDFTTTPTGGLVLCSIAVESSYYAASPSGGLALGGLASESSTYYPPLGGGAVLGGSASYSGNSTLFASAAGGAVVGGIAVELASFSPPTSGGVIAGGSAAPSSSFVVVVSSGVVAGGSAFASILGVSGPAPGIFRPTARRGVRVPIYQPAYPAFPTETLVVAPGVPLLRSAIVTFRTTPAGYLTRIQPTVPGALGLPDPDATATRTLTVQVSSQARYSRSLCGGYRTSISITSSTGVDPAVFLFLTRPPLGLSGAQYARFEKVCSPGDLAQFPVGAPGPEPAPGWFRLSAITLDFLDDATGLAARALILAQLQALLDALAWADELATATPSTVTFTNIFGNF